MQIHFCEVVYFYCYGEFIPRCCFLFFFLSPPNSILLFGSDKPEPQKFRFSGKIRNLCISGFFHLLNAFLRYFSEMVFKSEKVSDNRTLPKLFRIQLITTEQKT